jgi:MFS family permease
MNTNIDVAFDAHVLFTLLTVASIASIYLAGRIAERRGRRFKIWAWIAAMIGPLALPLIFLFPNLHRKNAGHG